MLQRLIESATKSGPRRFRLEKFKIVPWSQQESRYWMLTKDRLIRLCKARDQLQNFDHTDFSINEVAKSAAMSRYHFIRQFKAVFGETPVQFRTRVRLNWAKHLLVHGEESVTDICLAILRAAWEGESQFTRSPESSIQDNESLSQEHWNLL